MISALAGFIAGSIHVWSGPDHMAAIAPLAVRKRRQSWVPGLRWGVGHSAGVAVIGGLSLWIRGLLPLESLTTWGERLVGVMLIGIGAWALRKAIRVHAHEHEHNGEHHIHIHAHPARVAHEQAEAHQHHTHAAFGIGLLHGLAGSSHFAGVLPILALPNSKQALAYLGAFAIGTIASMAAFSWVMGFLASGCASRSARIYRGLLGTCAASAIVLGCFWMFR